MCQPWPWSFYTDTPGEKVCFIYGYQGQPRPDHEPMVQRTFYRSVSPGTSYVVTHLEEVENMHPVGEDKYGVTRAQCEQAMAVVRPGESLLGLAHTHPWPDGPEPSPEDVRGLSRGLLGVVVSGLYHREEVFIGEGSPLNRVLGTQTTTKTTKRRKRGNHQ